MRLKVKMVPKAFAVDVDGTITEDGGRISLDAAFTLRWLERLGHKVILVSGRGPFELYALTIYLGTTRVVVGENGGVVAISPSDMAILADRSHSLEAYELISKSIPNVRMRMPSFPRFTDVMLERSFSIHEGRRVLEEARLPVYLIDSKYAYHITHKSVNKANGLKVALKHLDIECEEVVAIGDSETDVPLFEMCGYSVALANAPKDTKARARHVTEKGMGEGLVEAVRHVVEDLLRKV